MQLTAKKREKTLIIHGKLSSFFSFTQIYFRKTGFFFFSLRKLRHIKKKKKKRFKRFSLTFIELFTCLAILALLSTFLMIKAQPMISFYQFRGGIDHLIKEIEWTQKIAVISAGYVDFTIKQKDNVLLCKRQTDEACQYTIKRFNHSFKMSHVSKITFKGHQKNQMKFEFNPLGFASPQGELIIYSTHNKTAYSVKISPQTGNISYKKISSSKGSLEI